MTTAFKKQILNDWIPMLKLWFVMLCVLVFFYAIVSTVLAHIFFNEQSRGSLLHAHHHLIGSRLYGQRFTKPEYFWGRPSMTAYQSDIPKSDDVHWVGDAFWRRYQQQQSNVLLLKNPSSELLLPSSSQVDPHLSIESMEMQIPRVLQNRQIPIQELRNLIAKHTQKPFLGIFGKTVVNVLEVNVGLDQYMEKHHEPSHT